jgi:Fe-S-cluster-containing hydrogenase component 2
MFLHDLSVAADKNCNGCRLCIKVCPVGAIELHVKGAKA